jgi:RNA polymerase sigma-70 factor (ECF subfamily)
MSSVLSTSDTDTEDRQALAAYRRGERRAFSGLVKRYEGPIYNAAWWILRRQEDACDVTQTTFLQAIEKVDDYDPQYRVFSWLYRIAVNEALDLLRRRQREEPLDDDFDRPDADAADPAVRLGLGQAQRQLQAALIQLSTADRTVLILRHFAELSYEEVAHALALDVKTVKSRLFEARRRLRERLSGGHE